MPSTTVAMSNVQNIDALLSGVRWTDGRVTFSFPNAAADYGTGYARNVDHDNNAATPPVSVNETTGFLAMSGLQLDAGRAAFHALSLLTNYTTREWTPDGDADVRLAMSSTRTPGNTTAYNAYPSNEARGGDGWFNPTDYNMPRLGTYAYQTFFHEIGHGLGLKHGHEADNGNNQVLTGDRDSLEFSTMTYRAHIGHAGSGGYGVTSGHYPQSYMMLDIAALQYMYGASYSTYAGDNTYRFNAATGEMWTDVEGFQGVPQNDSGNNSNVLFRTIWDGGGIDTYDFSGYDASRQMRIDLAPGSWTDVDADSDYQAADLRAAAPGTQIARGQVFNAMLFNNDPRSLIENAIGGAGDDGIKGNQAHNRLEGRGGNDTIEGFDGNDTLIQGAGGGGLYGGNGSDRLVAGDGAEVVDGGTGFDTADYSASANAVQIDTTTGKITGGNAWGDTLLDIEALVGSSFDDQLRMGAGNNNLFGGDGNDLLAGGAGADYLHGGEGHDSAGYSEAVSINLGTGVHGGEASGDLFVSIERYVGSAQNDTMVASNFQRAEFAGGDGVDTLVGGNLDDWLQGGRGADSINGGGGFDIVSYADAPYAITAELYFKDATHDGKITAGEWGLDTLIDIEDVEGTAFDDRLYGDEGGNKLLGLAGVDDIEGRGGPDILDGGAGDDQILAGNGDFADGGAGFDLLEFDPADGAVYLDFGAGTFLIGNGGFQFLRNFENYVGTAGNDTMLTTAADEWLTGGEGHDTLYGAGGKDIVNGGNGNDQLGGQGGDDVLVTGPGADWMDGGEGRDTVLFARSMVADWQAGVLDADIAGDTWLSWEVIQGSTGADRIRTNSWGYDVELRGGAGDDVLACGNGSDVLAGEDGADCLSGGAGSDLLAGGGGADRFLDLAAFLHGDTLSDFAVDDRIEVSAVQFDAVRYTAGSGLLELDSAADGSYATQLNLPAGLVGEFAAFLRDDATGPWTEVRLMADSDGDGVGDFRDNAVDVANPDQRDSNGDGYGNVVDPDLNQDLTVDLLDLSLFEAVFDSADADADFNGDGTVDLLDLSVLDGYFGGPPGRSYVDLPPAAAAPPAEAWSLVALPVEDVATIFWPGDVVPV